MRKSKDGLYNTKRVTNRRKSMEEEQSVQWSKEKGRKVKQ